MNKLLLRCSCASCCPSCSSITTQTIELVPCSSHSESYFSDHVKNHLNYMPFSCVVCKELGKVARLPSLEVMGISHTRREHSDLRLDLLSRPARLFTRTYTIPVIEELISQSISKRQSLNTIVTSSYGKHRRIHIPAAICNRSETTVTQNSNNRRNDAMTSMRVIFEGNRFVLKHFPRKSLVKAMPQPQVCYLQSLIPATHSRSIAVFFASYSHRRRTCCQFAGNAWQELFATNHSHQSLLSSSSNSTLKT